MPAKDKAKSELATTTLKARRSVFRAPQATAAFISLAIFALFAALTAGLYLFRLYHFRNESALVIGFRIGRFIHDSMLFLYAVEVVGILFGLLVALGVLRGDSLIGAIGCLGGAVLLFLNLNFFVNISEILIDDTHPYIKKQMQRLGDALEAYHGDYGRYPEQLNDLSRAPEKYATPILKDPYADKAEQFFRYYKNSQGWILFSCGLDGNYDIQPQRDYNPAQQQPSIVLIQKQYDPTNGIFSPGDIFEVSPFRQTKVLIQTPYKP